MVATVTFNPNITTSAGGSFGLSSAGYIQGQALDNPSARFYLSGGVLDSAETLPMWGGVAIFEDVTGQASPPAALPNLGGKVGRATTVTANQAKTYCGFSVFDQNYAGLATPQSPVPLTPSGGMVNFYRQSSNARIVVQCDPALSSLAGGNNRKYVSWDWVNQILVPYESSAYTISSGTYNNATGVIVLTLSAPADFSAGDALILSSLTGTGAYASLNGTWTATIVSGSTVTLAGPAGVGASTITGGSATLGSGTSSILPVVVLDVQTTNCMTVSYDPVTGFATWNRNGSCAVIQV